MEMMKDNKKRMTLKGRMAHCQQGVALIEFALTLPFLLLLLVGAIEITRMMLFYQKIDNATSNVADVITRMNFEEVPCTGPLGLFTIYDSTLPKMVSPYDFKGNGGGMIVSAVEAKYPDPNDASDDEPLRQRITWQWNSGGYASKLGVAGAGPNKAEWPAVFNAAPNEGGMFNGDRIIAVEVYYNYSPLLPGLSGILDLENVTEVYKKAFYRARFGNMAGLGEGCP